MGLSSDDSFVGPIKMGSRDIALQGKANEWCSAIIEVSRGTKPHCDTEIVKSPSSAVSPLGRPGPGAG